MNKITSVGKIGMLFMALALVAVLPLGFMQLQTGRMMNQVHSGVMSADEISGKQIAKELDIIEKLNIIAYGTQKSTSTFSRYQLAGAVDGVATENKSDTENSEWAAKLTEQLLILQKLGAIPEFSTKQMVVTIMEKILFSDNSSSGIVNTIDMNAICDGAKIIVKIDGDTGVIYQLFITPSVMDKAPMPHKFLEYLGIRDVLSNEKSDKVKNEMVFFSNGESRFQYVYGVYSSSIQYMLTPSYNSDATIRQ